MVASRITVTCANNNAGDGATLYIPIVGDAQTAQSGTESNEQIRVGTAGTFSNLSWLQVLGNRTSPTVRLRINAGNGNQIVTGVLSSMVEDTTHTDTVVAGDLVDYAWFGGSGGSTSVTVGSIGMSFDDGSIGATTMFANANLATYSNSSETSYAVVCGQNRSTTQAEGEWLVKLPPGVDHVTLKNLSVHATANTSTNAITVTVNGATGTGTAPNISIAGGSGATTQNDTTNTIQAKDGDKISYKVVTGASTVSCTISTISMDVQCDQAVYHLVAGSGNGVSMTNSRFETLNGALSVNLNENRQYQMGYGRFTDATFSLLSAYTKTGGTTSTVSLHADTANAGVPSTMSVATNSSGVWTTDSTNYYHAAHQNLLNYVTAAGSPATVTCIAITVDLRLMSSLTNYQFVRAGDGISVTEKIR